MSDYQSPIDRAGNVLRSVIDGVQGIAPGPVSKFSRLADGALDLIDSSDVGGFGTSSDFAGLMDKQMELQAQMMAVSIESNISRTDHETKMTPVRNMRVA